MFMKSYNTVKEHYSGSFTERHSEFISDIFPVSSSEEALELIGSVKVAHKKASHVVSAYVLRGGYAKFSDAGEPSGTAGKPVLDVITANELSDVLITVTRYFGGVLLGAGGLTRAYSTAASIAIKGSVIQTFMPCIPIKITLSYTLYGKFQAFCSALSYIKMSEPIFTDEVSVDIKIPTEMKDEFISEITDILNANFSFVEYDEIFADFS
jgi:uncharacterized YigZ family protein